MLPGEYSTYTASTGVAQCTHIMHGFLFIPTTSSSSFTDCCLCFFCCCCCSVKRDISSSIQTGHEEFLELMVGYYRSQHRAEELPLLLLLMATTTLVSPVFPSTANPCSQQQYLQVSSGPLGFRLFGWPGSAGKKEEHPRASLPTLQFSLLSSSSSCIRSSRNLEELLGFGLLGLALGFGARFRS
jgi:hypothetical protein